MWGRLVQWKGMVDPFTAFLILLGGCICDSIVGISEFAIYVFLCGIISNSKNSLGSLNT